MTEEQAETAEELVAELSSKQGIVRQRARQQLVALGEAASPYLVKALGHSERVVRWEAAKCFTRVSSPAAADALVKVLGDEKEDEGLRWLGAEALIRLGREGLRPLFEALGGDSENVALQHGAHHVLHDLRGKGLQDVVATVYAALDGPNPQASLPGATAEALRKLG